MGRDEVTRQMLVGEALMVQPELKSVGQHVSSFRGFTSCESMERIA